MYFYLIAPDRDMDCDGQWVSRNTISALNINHFVCLYFLSDLKLGYFLHGFHVISPTRRNKIIPCMVKKSLVSSVLRDQCQKL